MTLQTKYDLYSDEFRKRTYEVYAAMRRVDSVFQQPGIDGVTPIWFITEFADVESVLRDDKTFVLDVALALDPERVEMVRPSSMKMFNNHLLTRDGEDHRRLRALVSKAFTPRMIGGLRPRIQAIADSLVDRVAPKCSMDLVDEFAFPLPITVIAELLGIPSEDRDQFRAWSDLFVTPALSGEEQQRFMTGMMAFVGYLQALFDDRRAHPKEDLVSALLLSEEAGERLSVEELFSMVILLIVAGHETTVSLIGNATMAILAHQDVKQRLIEHPEDMVQAVEEFLRYESPVERAITRWVTRDITLHGQSLKRGDMIIAVLGSANRDEKQFPHPNQLDLDRDTRSHLAFGKGAHYCLGAPLARLEGEIALNTLLRRLPDIRLAAGITGLAYRKTPIFHAFTHIPVSWGS